MQWVFYLDAVIESTGKDVTQHMVRKNIRIVLENGPLRRGFDRNTPVKLKKLEKPTVKFHGRGDKRIAKIEYDPEKKLAKINPE